MSNTVNNLLNFGIRVTADDLGKIEKMVFLPNDAGKKMEATVRNLFLLGSIERMKDIPYASPVPVNDRYYQVASQLSNDGVLKMKKTHFGHDLIINPAFVSGIKNLVKSANAQEKADAAYWEKMTRKFQGLYENQVAETGHVKWLLRAALDELKEAGVKAASKARITARATKKQFQDAATHFMELHGKKDLSDVTLDDITKFKGIKTRR